MLDPLEPRTHLHAASLSGQLLIVEGGDGDDRFELSMTSTSIFVTSFDGGVQEPSDRFRRRDVDAILIYCGTGNDRVSLSDVTVPTSVDAGKGNDSISGGRGKDTLKGQAGNDTLLGNDGDDLIDGANGADIMSGGLGRDIVDYSKRTAAVRVGLGVLADDGEDGENDSVPSNFEIVRGGSGDDTLLTNSNHGVTLIGGAGNDTLTGNGGNDALDGGPGLDVMSGLNGDDTFYAADGVIERLLGGDGNDVALTRDKKDRLDSVP